MFAGMSERSEFVDRTLGFIASLVGSDRAAFYQVDERQTLSEFSLRNIDTSFHEAYVQEMYAYDPLHVSRLKHGNPSKAIYQFHEEECGKSRADIEKYRAFLTLYEISDVLEILFRLDGHVVAGASILRKSPDPLNHSLEILQAAHSYVEFNILKYIRQSRRYLRSTLSDRYRLSLREIDVAELICCGRTNAEVAECLQVTLATVKTHLVKIYQKLGVENRASLVSFISRLS